MTFLAPVKHTLS